MLLKGVVFQKSLLVILTSMKIKVNNQIFKHFLPQGISEIQ